MNKIFQKSWPSFLKYNCKNVQDFWDIYYVCLPVGDSIVCLVRQLAASHRPRTRSSPRGNPSPWRPPCRHGRYRPLPLGLNRISGCCPNIKWPSLELDKKRKF